MSGPKFTPGPWKWSRCIGVEDDEWGHAGPDLQTAAGVWVSCNYWCQWARGSEGSRGPWGKPGHEHFRPQATVLSSWGHDADGIEVGDTDAALIAAAPLLYEALERTVQTLQREAGWALDNWGDNRSARVLLDIRDEVLAVLRAARGDP